jgi:hypothetical protein
MKRLYAAVLLVAMSGALPLVLTSVAAADDTAAYYAVYCDPKGTPSVPDAHPGLVQCSEGGTPKIENTVKSPSDNPDGAHAVTIVQADCYPDPPGSASIVGGHIQCPGGGPNATLTPGAHFAANPQAARQQGRQAGRGNGNATPTPPPGNNSEIQPAGLPKAQANNDTINNIKNVIFGIIGAFALLSITLSGLKYITSSGDAQKTSEAKNGIVYSLVGLALAITADAIITFVVKKAS